MIGWSASLFAIVRSQFLEFRFTRFDLGNMVQAVWNTADGRPLETTFGTGEQLPRLASHVDPILGSAHPVVGAGSEPAHARRDPDRRMRAGRAPGPLARASALAVETRSRVCSRSHISRIRRSPGRRSTRCIRSYLRFRSFSTRSGSSTRTGSSLSRCLAVLAAATGELMGVPIAFLGLWYWLSRGHRRAGSRSRLPDWRWTLICVKCDRSGVLGGETASSTATSKRSEDPRKACVRTALTDPTGDPGGPGHAGRCLLPPRDDGPVLRHVPPGPRARACGTPASSLPTASRRSERTRIRGRTQSQV